MSFTVTYAIKDAFFDRSAVEKLLRDMDRATAKALKDAGAYLRRVARNSIKSRKKSSAPGSPPSNHAKKGMAASLKNILYGFDATNQTVTVGPIGFRLQRTRGVVSQSRPVPNVHEFGGFVHRVRRVAVRPVARRKSSSNLTVAQKEAFQRKIKDGTIVRPETQYSFIEENRSYPKRPFMKPALDIVAPKFPSLWTSTVNA